LSSVSLRVLCLVLFIPVVLVSACTPDENASESQKNEAAGSRPVTTGREGQTFVYQCGDGTPFTARIEGETAWLFLPSGTFSLPHVEAASGAKYSDGKTMFWSKGETAMVERAGHARTECTNNRRKAIWEDAKLRGADFRAVGNEPGWSLEISRDYGIVLVNNYGSDRYTFSLTEPVSDQESGTTVYKVKEGGHQLEIVLEGKACGDTMSDERFETTVTVILDETRLNGCGRPLH